MNTLLAVIPLSVVMIAGPQIVSAVMLATSADARRTSLAYIAGVATAVVAGVTVLYVVVGLFYDPASTGSRGSSDDVLDSILVALLLLLALRVYLARKTTQPPTWMGKLQQATPRFAFGLGVLLFLVMPTDVITMFTVGSFLNRSEERRVGKECRL